MAETTFELLKRTRPTISVGIMTADLLNLGAEIALMEKADVPLLHFDVIDGCFCPMTTVGPPFIKAVRTPLLKDVHLMIADPLPKLADYVAAGADIITVHLESCPTHIHRVFQQLGKMKNANDPARGLVLGVALNPGTPIQFIEPLLGQIDLICLLAVNPGWGGQEFIAGMRERLMGTRLMIENYGREILLQVDGGITRDNIDDVAAMGADIIVTGSAVFDGKTPLENARRMLTAVKTV